MKSMKPRPPCPPEVGRRVALNRLPTAYTAVAVTALLLISFHGASPVYAESPAAGGHGSDAVAGAQEPALLKTIAAARWRLASAGAALPPVQLVHNEALETQDFIQYTFDGGALRLCVSPGRNGGDIFALLVNTGEPRYGNSAQLASTQRYAIYHHGAYVVVVPLRPVSQELFDKLKARRWTADELQQHLGTPSYHWHVHGVGYSGVT